MPPHKNVKISVREEDVDTIPPLTPILVTGRYVHPREKKITTPDYNIPLLFDPSENNMKTSRSKATASKGPTSKKKADSIMRRLSPKRVSPKRVSPKRVSPKKTAVDAPTSDLPRPKKIRLILSEEGPQELPIYGNEDGRPVLPASISVVRSPKTVRSKTEVLAPPERPVTSPKKAKKTPKTVTSPKKSKKTPTTKKTPKTVTSPKKVPTSQKRKIDGDVSCGDETSSTSVKLKELRPKYKNLREWLEEDPCHYYVGRKGDVTIEKQKFPTENHLWSSPRLKGEDLENYIRRSAEELSILKGKVLGWAKDEDREYAEMLVKILE